MKLPGMTAGTCLRKDFTFSEERSPAPGMLLAVSRVNESVPLFLVDGIKRRLAGGKLRGRKVAVLGLAFKGDTDDERDSLSFKLMRLLERELALVAAHDPHSPSSTLTLAESVADADAVVLATNHSAWKDPSVLRRIADLASDGAVLADPWNCFGQDTVFGVAEDLASALEVAGAPAPTAA
jgi:UDP-N-acetyl-D-mannosaminuronic acid dehydrogenase